MLPARDGSGYGPGSAVPSKGPSEAIRKGAADFVMHSAGTDSHRVPHTGITRYDEGLPPIPAAALSVPDAAQLTRLLALCPVYLALSLDCGWNGEYTSHNVIGQITGGERPDEVVVIGGHLDSWDLGTGAVDDGAGVAITMAAGHLIGQLATAPKRSIRVIAFANEEQGVWGSKVYAANRAAAGGREQQVIAAESDFGAGRLHAFNTGSSGPARSRAATAQIAGVLAPLGIELAEGQGSAGPDISLLAARGGAWGWLGQDGSDYFHLHHTADDTLDKIDPAAPAQNVAACTVFAWLAAEAQGDFGTTAKPQE